jgi:cell filamentation protein, protein adenylyltransferase
MDWKDFSFDYELDVKQLIRHIIHIEAYKEAALNLVLPPEWRDQLDKLNRVRAVYGTTALEGNPLSEAEVSHQLDLLFESPEKKDGKATKEQLQIRNAGAAQAWVRMRFAPEHAPLALTDILHMHKMITDESDTTNNIPGALRTHSVVVGSPDMGGVHRGAPHDVLPEMMDQYIKFINGRKAASEHPVIHALLAHFFLVTIHPFGDGNGRVSRLVEAGILYQHGYNVHGFYGLSNYFYRNDAKYKTFLQQCRQCNPFDVTPFINFAIEGFAEELKGINTFIKTKLNRIVYRNTLVRAFNQRVGERRRVLNDREYRLLIFLITETEPIDPFSQNPSRKIKLSELIESKYVQAAYRDFTPRTFFRELSRLADMGFISLGRSDADKPEPTLELNFEAIGKY